jgi:hypothetical protein
MQRGYACNSAVLKARRGEGGCLWGAEGRQRGEEERPELVLQIGIQDTLELDLWVQLPRLLWNNSALRAAPW